MRKEAVLGLAGLILTGVIGCQMDRPYYSRYTAVQNHFAPAETPYRPKTVVTMRADEVPENPVPAPTSACSTVQLVGTTAAPVAQAPNQTTNSAPMVTVTIPAMKIVIPMTATMASPSTPAKETSTVIQLPATVSNVVQASSTAMISSTSSSPKMSDPELHSAVHVQKEETTSSATMVVSPPPIPSTPVAVSSTTTTEPPPLPDPVPEPKPKTKSAKKDNDAARLPRLSLLPPDPPPDVPLHRSNAPATAFRTAEPPPPPPIPKSSSSSGPILPSEEPELK
jgi:hypothetical protein